MFLMIENKGVADARSFTKLGLSTARGKSDRIGQFGTGAKHGILCLMRHHLFPILYCGKTKMEFVCQPNLMGDTEYNELLVKIDNRAPVELSFTLEFGALDWNDINMGLRELVSNAIDNCESVSDVEIKFVDKPRAKDGFTRIFVPMSPSVQQFAAEIKQRFLHFSNSNAMRESVLVKDKNGRANIYRKGVFVRTMESYYHDSLFDYNFGDEFKIDECRNADAWSCMRAAAKLISQDQNVIRTMFRRFLNGGDRIFEYDFHEYHLEPQSWWSEIWNEVVGENGVTVNPDTAVLSETLTKKGLKPVQVPKGWQEAMSKAKIRNGGDCLNVVENKGYTPVNPTAEMRAKFDLVWNWLCDCNMTNGKDKPALFAFAKTINTNDSGVLFGYYKDGKVFINIDYADNTATYIEELAHYITDAADNTREFQEFAFQFATRLAEILYV